MVCLLNVKLLLKIIFILSCQLLQELLGCNILFLETNALFEATFLICIDGDTSARCHIRKWQRIFTMSTNYMMSKNVKGEDSRSQNAARIHVTFLRSLLWIWCNVEMWYISVIGLKKTFPYLYLITMTKKSCDDNLKSKQVSQLSV